MRRFAISIMTAGLLAATSGIATTAIAAAQTPPVKKEGEIQNRQERQYRPGSQTRDHSLASFLTWIPDVGETDSQFFRRGRQAPCMLQVVG